MLSCLDLLLHSLRLSTPVSFLVHLHTSIPSTPAVSLMPRHQTCRQAVMWCAIPDSITTSAMVLLQAHLQHLYTESQTQSKEPIFSSALNEQMWTFDVVLIGLVYKAYPDGCQQRCTNPAEAKALPHEGALALVNVWNMRTLCMWAYRPGGMLRA